MVKDGKNLKSIVELRKLAQERGIADNPLFETTLSRYETQIYILEKLNETIVNSEVLVTKEYVKGRANIATHPAITEYNRTTDSANKTVSTLIRILKGFDGGSGSNEIDPLMEVINGDDVNE